MDLWLDRQTGSIEYLSSPATGVLLEGTRERSGLLDVAYPIKRVYSSSVSVSFF